MAIAVAIAIILFALTLTTISHPVYFPPAVFTNTTSIDPSQLQALLDPNAALAWDQEASSPSVLICFAAGFTGKCALIENNGKDICLGLNGIERMGSLKVGGGGGCVVFGGPACTGTNFQVQGTVHGFQDSNTGLIATNVRVGSVFCESLGGGIGESGGSKEKAKKRRRHGLGSERDWCKGTHRLDIPKACGEGPGQALHDGGGGNGEYGCMEPGTINDGAVPEGVHPRRAGSGEITDKAAYG